MARERTVFPTSEIPHLWAHQAHAEGRNQQHNLYFKGETLYSYRNSYPIARLITNKRGEKAVLLQIDTFSHTTAGHINSARGAVRGQVVFDVPKVATSYGDAPEPKDNLQSYAERIQTAIETVAGSRVESTRTRRYESLTALVSEANSFAQFYGIRKRFSVPSDMGVIKAKLDKQRAKDAKEKKERDARKLADLQDKIEAWKAGSFDSYYYLFRELPVTYLRIEGDELVTSRGARIPVDHAVRGLYLVRLIRKTGEAYKRNGHTVHLGHYAIDSIDAQGNVKAGCHDVSYEEIARIAPELEKFKDRSALIQDLRDVLGHSEVSA